MARLLTVPSGWFSVYAPTINKLQTLAAALSGTNAAINQAAETFSVEYPNLQSVVSFVKAGGVYVDYCGWPMYYPAIVSTYPTQGVGSYFGNFLSAIGADQYYCDGFDASQAGCMPNYPYDRGWLTKNDISSPAGLIYGKNGAACSSLVFGYGDSVYPMVAVRPASGTGIYFYGAAGSNGAIDPNQFANFILNVIQMWEPSAAPQPSPTPQPSPSPTPQPSPSPTPQPSPSPTPQQQCQAEGNVWYNNQCMTPAEYQCVINGGTWVNGVCQPSLGTPPIQPVSPNWPLIIAGGLVGIGLIVILVPLVTGGK